MQKITEFLYQWGPLVGAILLYLIERIKNFKYKKTLKKFVEVSKDGKVTEEEFQSFVDTVKEDFFKNTVIATILILLMTVVSISGFSQILIDGKPYSQIQVFTTDINAELTVLKARVASLEASTVVLTQTVANRDAEIIALKKRIAELEGTTPPVDPPPTTGELYFSDDFQGSTTANLLGGWTDWKSKLPFVEGIYFNNSGSAPYVIQEIRQDAGKNVLYARINDDSPSGGTTRAQMTVDLKQDMPVVHTSHRMKMHPDIAYMTNYSGSIRWFTLFEMWNLRDQTQGGDPAGSSRVSFSLFKASGTGQPLFWHVAYEEMQPGESVKWQNENRTVEIPFDKWFTLDVSIKRGVGTAGNIKITIQEDGKQPVTIFNENTNTVYRTKTDLYINQWQIFKLYSSDQIMDFMRNAGKEFSIMYNDVKWFKN